MFGIDFIWILLGHFGPFGRSLCEKIESLLQWLNMVNLYLLFWLVFPLKKDEETEKLKLLFY